MITRKRKLSAPQAEFLFSEDQFPLLAGGSGSGKSYAGAEKMLRCTLRAPLTGMILAPTYDLLGLSTLPTWREAAADFIVDESKKDRLFLLTNGSHVYYRTADDPEHLRGPNLGAAWLDELSLMAERVWVVLLGRLREIIYGPEGKLIQPTAFGTCTPKGQNWVARQWVTAGLPGYRLIRTSTYENSDNLARGYIRNMELAYTGKYLRQEVHGEFVVFEGLVYEMFSEARHIWPAGTPLPHFRAFEYGVDFGFAAPAAVSVHGIPAPLTINGKSYAWDIQVDELVERGLQPEELGKKIIALQQRWGPGQVACDPEDPAAIEKLRSMGLRAEASDNDVREGIRAEQAAWNGIGESQPLSFITASCVHTKAALAAYCWRVSGKTEDMRFLDLPEKSGVEHILDARRYRRQMTRKPRVAPEIGFVFASQHPERDRAFDFFRLPSAQGRMP